VAPNASQVPKNCLWRLREALFVCATNKKNPVVPAKWHQNVSQAPKSCLFGSKEGHVGKIELSGTKHVTSALIMDPVTINGSKEL